MPSGFLTGGRMIFRTFGFLGLLTGVMALSSLVYGAFQEPLGAYMQGVMGGVMEVYRTMRDLLFSGLGGAFSGLIDFAGRWFSWLPPAPWFTLPGWLADIISVWLVYRSSLFRGNTTAAREDLPYPPRDLPYPPSDIAFGARGRRLGKIYFYQTLLGATLFFLLVYAENQIGL